MRRRSRHQGGRAATGWAIGTLALSACLLTGCTLDRAGALAPPASPATATSATATVEPSTAEPSSTALPATQDPPRTGTAAALLATLPVKGRAPRTGYDRGLFGQAWFDVDRNGCDTRNDVLRRDLVDLTLKPGTGGCKATGGTLPDPYSDATVDLASVQVDHVVALSDAWQKGAQQWSPAQRQAFANDPLNLQPTGGGLNQAKHDSDAATWLPPSTGYRCTYVARQVAVKAKYGAWVTEAEREAIVRVLQRCPDEPAPTDADYLTPALQATADLEAAPQPTPDPEPTPPEPAQPQTVPPAPARSDCEPAYPGICLPPSSRSGDLDCGDISERRFRVEAPDPYNFDSDHDGIGCEGA